MSRLVLGVVMVAAAWTLAITGLVFVGDAQADAAWAKSGNGSSAAKAILLVTPGAPTVGAKVCNGNGPYAISLSWAYTGAPPPVYDIYGAPNNGATPTIIGTATSTSVNLTNLPAKPSVVSIRASAGTWHSLRSTEVNGC